MMNRFLRRLANKHLDINSGEALAVVLNWIAEQASRADQNPDLAPEVHSFLRGQPDFWKGLENAFREFERVVNDRETSMEIGEKELRAKNVALESSDERRTAIVRRLLHMLNELKADSSNTAPSIDEQSSDKGISSLLDVVAQLSKEHQELLELMKKLFTMSRAITASKTLGELEWSVDFAFTELTEAKLQVRLYSLEEDRYYEPATPGEVRSQRALLEDVLVEYGDQCLLLGPNEDNLPAMILVVSPDANIFKEGGKHFQAIKLLTPAMLSTLSNVRYIVEERLKAEMKSELSMARLVQQTLMPAPFIHEEQGFRVVGKSRSASECGGDWWNYYTLQDDRTLLLIGDVTGHGTASALVTAAVKGYFDGLRNQPRIDLLTIMSELDQLISQFHLTCDRAMTLAALIIDPSRKLIEYSLAGHPHPYLFCRNADRTCGEMTSLSGLGSLLGLSKHGQFKRYEATYNPGDILILYTDGITEAMNADQDQFGERRMARSLKQSIKAEIPLGEVIDRLAVDIYQFTGIEDLADDVTVVLTELL